MAAEPELGLRACDSEGRRIGCSRTGSFGEVTGFDNVGNALLASSFDASTGAIESWELLDGLSGRLLEVVAGFVDIAGSW